MIHKRVASLRTKLLYPLLWLWLVPGLIATISAFWLAGQAAQGAFDRVLKDDALALAAEVRWEGGNPSFRTDSRTAASLVFDSLSPSRFTVQTGSGRILVGNAELHPPALTGRLKKGQTVFYETQTSWGRLRTVALQLRNERAADTVWVIVGEAESKRDQISHELATAIFLPAAGVGFIIVPLLFLGVRYGLAPARDLVAAVTARGIDDLSPLPLDRVPDELKALIERVNELFARLSEAIAHERRFIADAAHQLRTPTAGIKLLAEDLLRGYQQDPAQPPDAEVLRELHAAAVRTSDLVRQLLTLARAERDPSLIEMSDFDMATLVRQVVERWQQVELAQGRSLAMTPELRDGGPYWLHSNPTLIEEALGNLLENALLYGGPNIRVGLGSDQGEVRVTVLDDGAALDQDTLEHLFVPFWRGADARGQGSGLGLAIAQRTLHSLGGFVAVQTRPQVEGNCFTLGLPAARTGEPAEPGADIKRM
jgi:two-component system sensor histidine kinase TctE